MASRNLNDLQPHVKDLALKFLLECKKQGLTVRVTQTLRTIEEQNQLYAQGRTKPGKIVTNAKGGHSFHNYGVAFDIVMLNHGKVDYKSISLYRKAGAIATKLGLMWGGNFKSFKDYPHFECTGGLTSSQYISGKRPVWFK